MILADGFLMRLCVSIKDTKGFLLLGKEQGILNGIS